MTRGPYKRWTTKDIAQLKSMYPHTCQRIIAVEMGISEKSVNAALKRFKLTRKMHKWEGGKKCVNCGLEHKDSGSGETRTAYSYDGFKTAVRKAPQCKPLNQINHANATRTQG